MVEKKYKQHKSKSSFRTVFKSFYLSKPVIKYAGVYSDIKLRLPKYLEYFWYAEPNHNAKYFMRC